MKRIKVLEWERISLIVPERQDAILWYEWINDIENQTFLNQRWALISLESEYDYYDDLKNKKDSKTFSIMINENWKIIWNISLFSISEKNRNATVWVLLWDKKEQNKWYGTESLKLILKYAFEVLWLHKVKIQVLSINPRAKAVYEKVWFKICGVLKDEFFDWEKYSDEINLEIFRKDFLQN